MKKLLLIFLLGVMNVWSMECPENSIAYDSGGHPHLSIDVPEEMAIPLQASELCSHIALHNPGAVQACIEFLGDNLKKKKAAGQEYKEAFGREIATFGLREHMEFFLAQHAHSWWVPLVRYHWGTLLVNHAPKHGVDFSNGLRHLEIAATAPILPYLPYPFQQKLSATMNKIRHFKKHVKDMVQPAKNGSGENGDNATATYAVQEKIPVGTVALANDQKKTSNNIVAGLGVILHGVVGKKTKKKKHRRKNSKREQSSPAIGGTDKNKDVSPGSPVSREDDNKKSSSSFVKKRKKKKKRTSQYVQQSQDDIFLQKALDQAALERKKMEEEEAKEKERLEPVIQQIKAALEIMRGAQTPYEYATEIQKFLQNFYQLDNKSRHRQRAAFIQHAAIIMPDQIGYMSVVDKKLEAELFVRAAAVVETLKDESDLPNDKKKTESLCQVTGVRIHPMMFGCKP